MSWTFTSAIDIGDRSQQQDRIAILHSSNHRSHLLVVADGMGGHEDGALAAQTVVDVASRHFQDEDFSDPGVALENICLDAHRAITKLSSDSTSRPGSTCVLLYLTDNEAYWTHIGDSRLYQFSENRCMYKTSDHSILQLIESQNEPSEQLAASQNQLYMCLGGSNDVIPESTGVSINPGDSFLLCSDGLWDQLELEPSILKNDTFLDQNFADDLVKSAKKRGNGKSDNISLLWACLQGSGKHENTSWFARFFSWFH